MNMVYHKKLNHHMRSLRLTHYQYDLQTKLFAQVLELSSPYLGRLENSLLLVTILYFSGKKAHVSGVLTSRAVTTICESTEDVECESS
jgi:hypothetical protein